MKKFIKKQIILIILLFLNSFYLYSFNVSYAEENIDTTISTNNTSENNNTELNNTEDVNNIEDNNTTNNTTDRGSVISDDKKIKDNNVDIKKESTLDNDITKTNENSVIKYIEDRGKYIDKKLNINKTDELQNANDKIKKEMLSNELEKGILEEMKKLLETKTNKISDDIAKKESTLRDLNEELLKEKERKIKDQNKIKELTNKIELYKTQIEAKKEIIKNFEEQKIINNNKIKELTNKVEELNIYKSKLEEKIYQEDKDKTKSFFISLFIYFLATIIYIIFFIVNNKYKDKARENNEQENLNKLFRLDVFVGGLYLGFILIFSIIKNPWLGLILILLGSSITIAIRPQIASLLAAFNLITKYRIGQIIKVGNTTGEIVALNLLAMNLNIYDEKHNEKLNHIIRIPNNYFMEKEVILINNKTELFEFEFKINFDDIKIPFNKFIQELDALFYKENISVIDNFRKKRYLLKLKGSNTKEVEFNIQYKTNIKEKVNVEEKILELISSLLKDKKEDLDKEKDKKD